MIEKYRTLFIVFILIETIGHVYANNPERNPQADIRLLEAIKNVDAPRVKNALAAGANPNKIYEKPVRASAIGKLVGWHNVALYYSEQQGIEETCLLILRLLFDAGAKFQRIDHNVLVGPIFHGLTAIVEFLIENGASPTATIDGMTPVEWAETYGHPEVVKVLLKYGAEPISKKQAVQNRFIHLSGQSYETNEHYEQSNIIEMERLLSEGAQVDGTNSKGDIALGEAVRHVRTLEGYVSVIYLLQKGANPNLQSEEVRDFTGIPLHNAIAVMSLLADKQRIVPMVYSKLTVEALLEAGAHVSSRGDNGETPLHIAAKYNGLSAAEMLIQAGAKVMDRDDNGKTPLDYAESSEIIKLLKSHGAKEQ